MNIKQIILISFIGLSSFFLIIPIVEARLVPCGSGTNIECEICHIFVILWRVIRFILFTIVPPLAALIITIAGFKYYSAAGDPGEAKKAKDTIIAVAVSLLILYGSLGFLTMFTEHIGKIPIYSHVRDIIDGCDVPTNYWD